MNYKDYCQPVARVSDIQPDTPYSTQLAGKPVVVFRGADGELSAFADFCPHRGARLSAGKIKNGELECPYHGWRFNSAGQNTCVPVNNKKTDCQLRPVQLKEAFGVVWLAEHGSARLPELESKQPQLTFGGSIKATLVNALENFMEGSHTHFVHNGLVRTSNKARQQVQAELKPGPTGFQVNYEPEPAKGLLTGLLPKKYRTLTPVATFIFPATALLEYFNAEGARVFRAEMILRSDNTSLDYFARVYVNAGAFTPLATFIGKPLLEKVIEQDKQILEQQEQNLQAFGNTKFHSTEADLVGNEIYAWLYAPERRLDQPRKFIVHW